MYTFAQKKNQSQKEVTLNIYRSNQAAFSKSHPIHPILNSQPTIGDQAVQKLFKQAKPDGLGIPSSIKEVTCLDHDFSPVLARSKSPASVQAKLKVNAPGDIYEQEADRIADQVLSTPMHSAGNGALPRIQHFLGQPIRYKEAAPKSVDQALASPGKPLEPMLLQDMEQRFGYDFSRVRVHSGSVAEQSAQDMNAHAYTVGSDVIFGAGRFAPETHEGRRLIAHELAHVVQRRNFILPYRPKTAFHFNQKDFEDKPDQGRLKEDSFDYKKNKGKKPWIEFIIIDFTSKEKDIYGNEYWVGTASVKYYKNSAKLDDFSFDVAGGSKELGITDRGNFTVYRIEGIGYNSGLFSGIEGVNYDISEREGPGMRYSKNFIANMSFAIFFNKGEALHVGPLDISSHGCVHVPKGYNYEHIKQVNYHSVIGHTKVIVNYRKFKMIFGYPPKLAPN